MADSFERGSEDRTAQPEKERKGKAEAPQFEKPSTLRRRPGGLLTDLILFLLDTALTLFLFITPFCVFGAYSNFVLPEFAFGVIYVIVRIVLGRVEHTKTIDVFYILLRIAGCTVAGIYFIVLFNFGNTFGWFYPVRRYLYVAGNYSDASYFEFLPDRLPEKTGKYHMSFVPPVYAPDAVKSIDIHFFTDADGAAGMRSEAVSKGGVLWDPEKNGYADDFERRNMELFCEKEKDIPQNAELYKLPEKSDSSLTLYLINEDTGYCRVFWAL